MPRRRYQEGRFVRENGKYYSFFYRDKLDNLGIAKSVLTRNFLGSADSMSELQARREHDRLRNQINRERGSVPVAPKGETFGDAAKSYLESIAPHLAVSTLRQRSSHLRFHLLPKFGGAALMSLDIQAIQRFATDMLASNSRKTILNVLGTLFAVLDYASKCEVKVSATKLTDIQLISDRRGVEGVYLTPQQVETILAEAREPYKTMFTLAWATGFRAGELLGLSVDDIDFKRLVIQPRFQSDDSTRSLRELKTKFSNSPIAITKETAKMLTNYLVKHWRQNEARLLFPNRNGRPWKREYVVKFGLRPVLRKLGYRVQGVGLHAFRHGLGTALSNAKVSPKTVQRILRHSDIKTTFRYYVHSDMDQQRDALEALQSKQFVSIETEEGR